MNITFDPYKPKRASEEISEAIKQAILTRELKPGDRLPTERALAEQFQVGRLTVREALRNLESNGLVLVKQGGGGGIYVGTSDPDKVPAIMMDNLILEGLTGAQITEARLTVECGIVVAAIENATGRDLARIEGNVTASRTALEPERGADAFNQMINFHILLGEATHNPIYSMFIRSLMDWGRRRRANWTPTREQQQYSYRSHREIFEAVVEKKIDAARDLISTHVKYMEKINQTIN